MEAIGSRRLVALDDEERPDQVVDRQHVLAHEAARPVRLAVAARALAQSERRSARALASGLRGAVATAGARRSDAMLADMDRLRAVSRAGDGLAHSNGSKTAKPAR